MTEPALKKLKSSLSSSQDANKNVFQSLLDQSGVSYDNQKEGFKVEDNVACKKSITQALQFDKPLTQQFVNDLEQELADPNTLKTYLVPVVVSTSDNLFQESVIKLLLNIDCVQPFLINILLEKLPQFNEDESVFDKFNQSISRNIISHLKWLDHIVDSSKLVQKLVEILPICDSKLQKEIITSIPEILEDTSHENIVVHLLNLMSEDSQFTLPVIDTLTNLNLSPSVQDQVRGSIMKTLTSASLDQLPLIIKFILQSVTSSNLPKIIHELREYVVIETFSLAMDSQSALSLDPSIPSTNNNNQPRDIASLSLLLDALKSAFRFNKEIATAFIKEIQSIEVAEEHKLLDFFILLILYSLNTHKKTAESILRKKIQNNLIGENLIKSALVNHSVALKEYVTCIISLAEAFLRSNDSSLMHSASDLYSLTFKLCKDNVHKQDIIGSLVTHVGSGTSIEIDAALSILESLVEEDALSLVPYSVFIKGIIDYIFNLEDKQVRKVFHIFSCLSSVKLSDRRSNSTINDELFIVLRKQISSGFIQFKKVGIIGAVAMIMTFGNTEYVNSTEEESMSALIELIESIQFMTKKYPICNAFFCDELSTIMNFKRLNPKLINYLKEIVEAEWQNLFLDSASDLDENSWMKIDDNQNTFEIKIGSVVNSSLTLVKESACLLCSQFKLLQLCERQLSENELSALAGVLGTSINLFEPSLVKKIHSDKKMKESEKESICLCMFYALNWFRELINAFSTQAKDEYSFSKIVKRIEHTIQLEDQLDGCLASLNHITLPAYNNSGSHTITLKESSNKKKSKAKANEAETSKKDEDDDDDNSTTKTSTSSTSSDGIYVALLRPFFRDFDLSACSLLAYQLNSDSEDMSNIYTFSLPVIRYLVEETQNKIKYIVGSTKKKLTFLPNVQKHQAANIAGTISTLSLYKPFQALKELIPVFPALFIHFGRVFQSMIDEVDEMTDVDVANYKHHKPILISILEIFEKTMIFLQEENSIDSEYIMREILYKIVFQKKVKKPKLSELYKDSFLAFESFMEKSLEDSKLAISLTSLLKCWSNKNIHPELANKLSKYAQKQLKKEWDPKLKSEQVSLLLETHVTFATNSLEVIEFLALNILPNSIKKDPSTEEEEIESEYNTLTKATWIVYFKVLLTQLTIEFSHLIQSSVVKDEENTFEDYLIKVEQCVKILFGLIEITKIKHDNKQILAVALKQGKTFTEIFMKVIPTLSQNFAEHKEAINRVIFNLQRSTRQIQSLCAHSKTNESKLASVVPSVRKVLELFVFKVKAMLKENNQAKRFWLGNLKPKSITGEAIKDKQEDDEEEEEESVVQDDIEEDNEEPPAEPQQDEQEEEEEEEKNDESDEIVDDD